MKHLSTPLRCAAATLALAGATLAHAGRPLGTDDAATADPRTCLMEGWLARAGSERATVLGGACGVAPGVEIGADYTLPHHRDVVRGAAGLGLKWVPEHWQAGTPLGAVNFGLKFAVAAELPAGAGWRRSGGTAQFLATLKPADERLNLHLNLGAAHDTAAASTATTLKLAGVWSGWQGGLLFAEVEANSRRAVFGGTARTAGARWWVVKDQLGLDLTASRESGSSTTLWTVGFGWYGIAP